MTAYSIARRRLLSLLGGGAVAWPIVPRAQPTGKSHRILWVSTEAQPDPFLDGFREGLRQRGYVEGQNLVIESRYAPGNPERLRAMIVDVMRSRPDLVVSSGPAMRALKEAKDIPVVFAVSGDPVELGIAQSLSRPGGNFTGVTFLSLDLAGKRVELLKEAIPRLRTLAILSNTDHPGERSELRATLRAAEASGIVAAYVPFLGASQLDKALAAVRDARAGAMLVFPEGATMANRAKVAQFAIASQIPSMFGWREYCDAGGLMSYGANQRAAHFRLAAYADRVLRGENPANIPIEQPTKFELIINLKTAKTLGLTLSSTVLTRADEVIE